MAVSDAFRKKTMVSSHHFLCFLTKRIFNLQLFYINSGPHPLASLDLEIYNFLYNELVEPVQGPPTYAACLSCGCYQGGKLFCWWTLVYGKGREFLLVLSCIVCHVAGELVVPLTAVFMNSNGIGSSLGLELYFIANLTFGV